MTAIGMLARAELRRGSRSLVVLALPVAVVGTVVVGVLVGARRTSTAPARIMEAQGYPDLTLQFEQVDDATIELIRRLPQVEASAVLIPVIGRREPEQDWYQVTTIADADPGVLRLVLAEGRMFDPAAEDEVVMPVETARLNGLDVGSTFSYGLYTAEEWRQVLEENRYPPPTGPHPTP